MKKQVIYKEENLSRSLLAGLPHAAASINALGELVRADFPALQWGAKFVWALSGPYEAAKQAFSGAVLLKTASKMGIAYPRGLERTLDETQRLEKKLVELQASKAIEIVWNVCGVEALRTGAITFDKNGTAVVAENAAELLSDFCTIYAENEQEARFYAALQDLQDAAKGLAGKFAKLEELAPNKAAKADISLGSWGYNANSFIIGNPIGSNIRITGPEAGKRAFFAFVLPGQRQTQPKYYNDVGTCEMDSEERSKVLGVPVGIAVHKRKFVIEIER